MSDVQEIKLSRPQFQLVTCPAKYPAFVGGFGSGKTEALINRTLKFKFQYVTCNFAYYLPTYDLVRMIAFPRFEEKLEDMKIHANWLSYKSVKSPRPSIKINLYGEPAGEIIFRTMDNPSLIVGYEVADSAIDELDVMKRDDAEKAWRKIVARNRQKKPDAKINTIAVGTTPEGFKFVYERWQKDPKPGYHLIPASTYSNQKNLPADYIDCLKADYPANLIAAYVNGDFVNLTSGSVYPDFDRVKNACSTVLTPEDTNIHIGMDFNVTKMAAIVWKKVQRELAKDKFVEEPHAVEEITKIFDTPAMIKAINERYPNKIIHIYPDASGNARKSNNASESDLSLLSSARFIVHVNHANPAVKDRVLAMNVAILNGEDRRLLRVNIDNCPTFVNGLEQQIYNTQGEPDKSNGLDHCLDAGGYFIAHTYPVKSAALKRVQLAGV